MFQVADGVFDLGVAAMIDPQVQSVVSVAVGDATVIAVGGAEDTLGAVRGSPLPIAFATWSRKIRQPRQTTSRNGGYANQTKYQNGPLKRLWPTDVGCVVRPKRGISKFNSEGRTLYSLRNGATFPHQFRIAFKVCGSGFN